jgi:hypothetical protein
LDGLGDEFSGTEGLAKWIHKVAEPRLRDASRAWDSSTRVSARLANVDGALICNSLAQPVAFGLKFSISDSGTLPEECTAFLKGRVTRHLFQLAADR